MKKTKIYKVKQIPINNKLTIQLKKCPKYTKKINHLKKKSKQKIILKKKKNKKSKIIHNKKKNKKSKINNKMKKN